MIAMVNIVNWAQLWKAMLINQGRIDAFNPKYWEKHVDHFVKNTFKMNELTQKQLDLLQFSPQHSVLEVGGGTGRITMPVAKRAKQVTVVEPSMSMLTLLKENAQKQNVTNITTINKSWEDTKIGVDVPVHDIVFASFSLFMNDTQNALKKLDAAAKKQVYLFTLASKWMDEDIQQIAYGQTSPIEMADYIYIYNILYDLGIIANITTCVYEYNCCYSSFNDAVSKFIEYYNVPSRRANQAKEYLQRELVEENGKLWLKRNQTMALLSWTKSQS
jgi:FkbM family methyltransferase